MAQFKLGSNTAYVWSSILHSFKFSWFYGNQIPYSRGLDCLNHKIKNHKYQEDHKNLKP